MVKIIDGKGTVLGRLASFAAKEAIRGEEIVVLNCEQIIITGNKKKYKRSFSKEKGKNWKWSKRAKIFQAK